MIYNIKTNFSNYSLVWESNLDCFIALKETSGQIFTLYENVYLCADAHGHIDIGLSVGGVARIVAFREDATDRWIGVLNAKAQFGWVKPARVKKITEEFGNILK